MDEAGLSHIYIPVFKELESALQVEAAKATFTYIWGILRKHYNWKDEASLIHICKEFGEG